MKPAGTSCFEHEVQFSFTVNGLDVSRIYHKIKPSLGKTIQAGLKKKTLSWTSCTDDDSTKKFHFSLVQFPALDCKFHLFLISYNSNRLIWDRHMSELCCSTLERQLSQTIAWRVSQGQEHEWLWRTWELEWTGGPRADRRVWVSTTAGWRGGIWRVGRNGKRATTVVRLWKGLRKGGV